MTGWGGTQRLPKLVGEAAALEIFLMGRKLAAVDALQLGMVDEVADDPLEAATQAYL
jgi:enoyl-CoA hydratase/carnithine racemase